MPHRLASALLGLALLLAVAPVRAAAQEASPVPSGPPDLAAMALSAEDVPAGYFDDYGELLYPAAAVAGLVLGEPAPAGLAWLYQSYYFAPEQGMGLTVSLLAFASPDAAAAGAGIVDALLRPPLPEGTTVGPARAPGPAIGDEPRTLTTVTYDTWAAGGPRVDVVAASFRHDRLVAVLAVERWTDPPEDGTPVADGATPTAVDPAQERLAADLAETLEGRIADVLAGTAPAGVDFALADALLPVERLADPSTPVFGGYKSGIDLLRCGICGEENALLPFADAAVGGVARGVAVGPLADGEPQPPFVAVAVAEFASPEDALAVLRAIRRAPNDRPTAIPVPRGAKTLVADPVIPGASAALAFSAVFDAETPGAVPDSAGVDFVAGSRLVTVDVQGGLEADAALAAAVDLATQQAACLAKGGSCGAVTVPAAIAEAAAET